MTQWGILRLSYVNEVVCCKLSATYVLRLQGLPKSQPFVPRLDAVRSWQDMLPLAADVLTRVTEEVDNPTPINVTEVCS